MGVDPEVLSAALHERAAADSSSTRHVTAVWCSEEYR
jgi:hypothetical protein